jgi:hypothetical protein
MEKESKINKAISITKEVNDIISELQTKGFNFSGWVCNKVLEEFENLDKIDEKIKNKEIEIEELKKKKIEISKRKHQIYSELKPDIIEFIKGVPEKLARKFDIKDLLSFFNNETGLNYSKRKFLEIVRYYNGK